MPVPMTEVYRPLASLRVLDVGGADSDAVSRLLGDLGADVLKIELPGGSPGRVARPTVVGTGVAFALHNANKRSSIIDAGSATDRDRFIKLVGEADILIDGGNPGGAQAFGTSAAKLADRFTHLVAMSVTDFGATGPYARWQATDAVLCAMSTALSRSGPTTGTPVLPPHGIASGAAAVQAAWAALVAYHHRLRCGRGDYIDFSRFEAVVQSLDPPFGSHGQAAAGMKATNQLWRGRPRSQQVYPIFGCSDGFVRICLFSPRQWRGMWAWLGEPEEFSDPKFDTIAARYGASKELNAAIADLFSTQTMESLVIEGQARGVPIAAVLSPTAAQASDHFRAVGVLTDVEIAAGTRVAAPSGPVVINGVRAGLVAAAPNAGSHDAAWRSTRSEQKRPADGGGARPFDGMRILDLGVIVAGGELGRLFADLGAEVIKIESLVYPDGLRQTMPGQSMSRSWALTHRNESSLGLELRNPEGAAIFRRLVAMSDAVFANFKPGTLASLGFSFDELRAVNPRIVLAESSAFGAAGPWSARMGYGPLVRAVTGISHLWTADGLDGFYDATTVFPDHVAARVTAIAALAALIGRTSSGTGAHVHISQAEAAVDQLAVTYVTEAAKAAGLQVEDSDAVHGVYACAGDDEWCVVSIRSLADRKALAGVLGLTELPESARELADAVSSWTVMRDKGEVTRLLQGAGVPAAPMNRAADVLDDPQVVFRRLFTEMTHPMFDAPMPTETRPALSRHIPAADLTPAPMPGEHTREICHKLLGMDAEETERLFTTGALFSWSNPNPQTRSPS
jgi:crotonobetainyl-CoA:carnitine CoA-transferase CaiB-like acyl-CoA transferase